MKRIPDEEIVKAVKNVVQSGEYDCRKPLDEIYKAVAQAQLESCEKDMRELFEGIERNCEAGVAGNPEGFFIQITDEEWKDLKEKYL